MHNEINLEIRGDHTMNETQFVYLWVRIVNIVNEIAREFDERWRKRKRKLDSKFLVLFILRLVLSKNKQGYGCTLEEIWEQSAQLKIQGSIDKPVSASSICEARQKLDETIFQELNDRIIAHYEQEFYETPMWHNHRLFAVDGSKINLPRQLIEYGYTIPSQNAYYPQGLVSCLYQLTSQIPLDFMLVNHCNERICAQAHLEVVEEGDVVVYDRGYFSYIMLHTHIERQIHCIFRLRRSQTCKEIVRFWDTKDDESIVMIYPAKTRLGEIKKQYPGIEIKPLKLRLIKYTIEGDTFCLGTTLIGKKYPVSIFSDVYHSRWGIEELYKVSKQLIDVEDFHSQSERGVKQELYAHFFLITAARIFQNEAHDSIIKEQNDSELSKSEEKDEISKGHTIKVNFKNCLLVLTRSLEDILFHDTIDYLKRTVTRMLESISRLKQKIRPERKFPRQSRKPSKKWRPLKST